MDFVENNATVFTELIQYLDDKSLSLLMRDAKDDGRKAIGILMEHFFIKRKTEGYFPLYRANIFEETGISVYYRLYNKNREYF